MPGNGKIDPDIIAEITKVIRAGNYAQVAAQYVGISESTFYRWMERGEKDPDRLDKGGLYRELWESVKKAETQSEVRAVAIIQDHMKLNWAAAMTYLERKHPRRWGRRETHAITGADGGPLKIEWNCPAPGRKTSAAQPSSPDQTSTSQDLSSPESAPAIESATALDENP